MKRLTVLGVTGSVGRRALELVEQFPGEFKLEGMAARGSSPETIVDLCVRHRPRALALFDPAAVDAVARALPRPHPEILSGQAGLVALAGEVDADIVLSAIVGGAGLLPTMAAIQTGKAVALANKEPLVMAGSLMTAAARERKVPLLPVDSEHSAIFQCLEGHNREDVRRILLTASGGPFRTMAKEDLAGVTVAEALRHPTWKMGAKITIDSATLMNKGLEVIEARWLFDLRPEQVDVVVHPQSIVHSMVEYVDGSVIAQLGVADMGIPILYALTYPAPPALRRRSARADAGGDPHVRGRGPRQVPVSGARSPGAARGGMRAGDLERRQRGGGGGVPRRADRVHPDPGLDRRSAEQGSQSRPRRHRAVRGDRRYGRAPWWGAGFTPNPWWTRRRDDGGREVAVTTIVAFVVVLGILILVHEFGHFIVARLSGVGVERFSVGFGPVLWRYRGKETEYCLSAFPLGGYVKMMGDDENPLEGGKTGVVDPAKAFNLKPLYVRFLIVFAGPAMNGVLAVVIFALVFMIMGRPVAPAVAGRVVEGGPAAQAGLKPGDRIVAVDGQPVQYWEDVLRAVQALRGETIQFTVRTADGAERKIGVTPVKTKVRDLFGDEREVWDIGARPFAPPIIGDVVAGMPAERAGLKSGDVVLSVEGQPVRTWDDLAESIHKRAGQPTRFEVKRGAEILTLTVTPTATKDRGPGREGDRGRPHRHRSRGGDGVRPRESAGGVVGGRGAHGGGDRAHRGGTLQDRRRPARPEEHRRSDPDRGNGR